MDQYQKSELRLSALLSQDRYKVGVALSGGGSRGIVHLGVLKALSEIGICPDVISGVSAGGIVGAFVAAGYHPDEIMVIIRKERFFRLIQPAVSMKGLLSISSTQRFFEKYLPPQFSNLSIGLTVNATDLLKGESVYFDEGPLIPALQASCAIPVIFKPVSRDGMLLVDGGVVRNLPAEPLVGQCDYLISVSSNPFGPREKPELYSFAKILERTQLLSVNQNTMPARKASDLLIEPPKMHGYGVFDLSKAEEIFEVGYAYTKVLMSDLLSNEQGGEPIS